jgi:hypothetical protein
MLRRWIPGAIVLGAAAAVSAQAPGVDVLKGDEYVRVWINRGSEHYIIHLPPARN